MMEIEDLLTEFMEDVKKDILADMRSKGQYATGKTEKLFDVLVVPKGKGVEVQLWGPDYLRSLITGRGPTLSGKTEGRTLQEALFEWIQAKNIMPREEKMTQLQLSWAMSKHMHTYGNLLYQNNGDTGLLANNITKDRVDNLLKFIGEDVQTEVIDNFNQIMQK